MRNIVIKNVSVVFTENDGLKAQIAYQGKYTDVRTNVHYPEKKLWVKLLPEAGKSAWLRV